MSQVLFHSFHNLIVRTGRGFPNKSNSTLDLYPNPALCIFSNSVERGTAICHVSGLRAAQYPASVPLVMSRKQSVMFGNGGSFWM